MIELPEAYVLAEQAGKTLAGKRITNVTAGVHPHKFASYTGDPFKYHEKLYGKTVTGASPGTQYTCGGNIEIECEDMVLVFSTPLKYHAEGEKLPAKHQLLIEFDDMSHLSATVQMWGAMFCLKKSECRKTSNRPTPLESGFNEKYFGRLLDGVKSSISVKALLAAEQRIPGFGNGVLQDILFNARINPKTKLDKLNSGDFEVMFKTIKSTLLEMTLNGGRDTEKDIFGANGGYKTILSSKTIKKPCPVCEGTIMRESFLGGNIYYCPKCQKQL